MSIKGKKQTQEHINKRVALLKGKKRSLESRLKMSKAHLGKKMPLEQRKKIAISCSGKYRGEKAFAWKGGVNPINNSIRNLPQYKDWRQKVFERDNFTCIWCGQLRGEIQADHIIPLSLIVEKLKFECGVDKILEKAREYALLWDISNGRTLCHKCHKTTNTYGVRKDRNHIDYVDF